MKNQRGCGEAVLTFPPLFAGVVQALHVFQKKGVEGRDTNFPGEKFQL